MSEPTGSSKNLLIYEEDNHKGGFIFLAYLLIVIQSQTSFCTVLSLDKEKFVLLDIRNDSLKSNYLLIRNNTMLSKMFFGVSIAGA